MTDDLKIVYVVSYMPSFEGSSMAGFDWYAEEDEAREAMIDAIKRELGSDWSFDYTLRSMLVPRTLTNEQITELLDTDLRDLREVALPGEWLQIRHTGGVIELEVSDDR
jgi:hypothetical protein